MIKIELAVSSCTFLLFVCLVLISQHVSTNAFSVGLQKSQRLNNNNGLSIMAAAEETTTAETTTLTAVDSVACFGRLADKAFVLPTDKVEGTAASGYEFGVLESGRPKWLCTYQTRTGKTQGGGNEMTHVPNWCQNLFQGGGVSIDRAALRKALFEDLKYQMPLGAPSGTFAAKEAVTNEAVVDALWKMLGGGDSPLDSEAASLALRKMATENGSDTEDHLTYAVFEKAFFSCGASS